ncbi:G5P family DNA-binding protein [Erythrobacter ani]|uniref:Single-stranded DNA-binding protein n=1 Tax=Erythrobacter ani TaxID=2827235 RepID=A0ABS6SR94_9SPHN|nr:hypothetical protein [Erythrobacter ani]
MNLEEFAKQAGLVLVEIDGSGVEQARTYTDKLTGQVKPLPGRQTGFIWQGGKYPVEVGVDFPTEKGPYAPGMYFLGGPIFSAGDYGRVQFKGTRELNLVDADEVLDRLTLAASAKGAAGPKEKAA